MGIQSADDNQTPKPDPNDTADSLLGSSMPPTQPEPAKVTLTIDLGTLTPTTVRAIMAFVDALANDPAKGAGSGPRPGAIWAGTLPDGTGPAGPGVLGATSKANDKK